MKNTSLILIALLAASCSNVLDKPCKQDSLESDFLQLKEILPNEDFLTLVNYVSAIKGDISKTLGKTYRQLLDEAINFSAVKRVYDGLLEHNLTDGISFDDFHAWLKEDVKNVTSIYELLDDNNLISDSYEDFFIFIGEATGHLERSKGKKDKGIYKEEER
ncbi:MAG: hypothetical protein P1U70_20950 [Saprospiraceae bacterium]|nr:hypothetical protein [Saprospiraceae bacterium]